MVSRWYVELYVARRYRTYYICQGLLFVGATLLECVRTTYHTLYPSAPFASRPTTTAAADRRHKNATAQEPQEGEPQRDLESRISSDLPQCSKSSTGDF